MAFVLTKIRNGFVIGPMLTAEPGRLSRVLVIFLIITAVSLLSTWSNSAYAQLEVIVPAYFYPVSNSPWDDLNLAANQVEITAIMNPASGSGNSQDGNYVTAVDDLRSAGGQVVGYVPTTFGQRPLADVKADIDNYYDWYNIDGIFLDEMSNTGPASRIQYYQDLYAYVKSKDNSDKVIGNPGTNTLEQYLNFPGGPTADTLVITENIGSQYASFSPAPWVANYDASNFAHLIHTEPSSVAAIADLDLAVQRNAGAVYFTDDVLNNPWDRLPTYWQAEIDAIEQINNATVAGDFDGDADVDGADFLQWQREFGNTLDASDLADWLTNYGPSDSASISAVPEPCSILLVSIALTALLFRQRRV